jgi:hypothetical protein
MYNGNNLIRPKKKVPKAINKENNLNKEKSKDSISHVVCAGNSSMSCKHKKASSKQICVGGMLRSRRS